MYLPSIWVLFSVAFTPFFTAVTPCSPTRCGVAKGHERRPQLVLAGAGAVNRSWTLPKARVTARVRLRERVSRQDEPTSRVGICLMSRSFGTLGQLNILAQVCNKLGLTRDGRMPDLRSDQGAKQKASEYGARRGPGLFTELFTARYKVVTIG